MNRFRLVSCNIHHAFAKPHQLERTLSATLKRNLRRAQADLVCLQDLNPLPRLSDLKPSLSGWQQLQSTGAHNNLILSRDPIANCHVIPLNYHWHGDRNLIYAKIGTLHLFCVNLGLFSHERRWQIAQIIAQIKALCLPTEAMILAGEFNDWTLENHHDISRELNVHEALADCFDTPIESYPAFWPLLKVDRIYYRNLNLHQAGRLVDDNWRPLSNHCPLFADFDHTTAKSHPESAQ